MIKENTFIKKMSCGITAFLLIFSYALCFSAVLQLNIWYVLITTVISAIISVSLKEKVLAPDTFFVVPLILVLSAKTNALLPFTVIVAAFIFIAARKMVAKKEIPNTVISALSLGLAFSVTALLTTHYFGIGANGFTVMEILKNYRYLGFHPNWRGVFYGTITLFAMITYPFKFKKANKYLPAEAFSLLLPLILNLILNPNKEATPINEIASITSFLKETELSFFLPSLNTSIPLSIANYISAFKGALSLGVLLLFFSNKATRTASQATGNILCGISGAYPTRAYEIRGYSVASSIVAVFLATYSCYFLTDIIDRIPLHSLAVVLIVAAWKQVPFAKIGKVFKSGIVNIIALIVIFLAFIFYDVFIAIIISIFFIAFTSLLKGGKANGQ